MADQRAQYESELKRRLALRSTNEESYLIKAFQYYDLQGLQNASLQNFIQVNEKLGIQLPPQESQKLYEFYKSEGQFKYKSFANRILQQPEQIVFYFQKKFIEGGHQAAFDLLSNICDTKYASFNQFKSYFSSHPEEKIRQLFSYFDLNKQNKVAMKDVFEALRGPVIHQALNIDRLNPQQLIDKYRGDRNVIARYINIYTRYKGIKEFDQQSFDEFNHLLTFGGTQNNWNLDQSYIFTPQKKLDFKNEFDLSEIQKLLAKRGTKAFVNLKRLLINADTDQDGYLSEQQVQKVFRDYKLPLAIPGLYIDQFWSELLGQFQSVSAANQIFSNLDVDFDDLIPTQFLKSVYNAKNHPDVRNRLRSENEVLAEFLDAFDAFIPKSEKNINKKQFIEFMHIEYVVLGEQFEQVANSVYQYNHPKQQQQLVSQYAPFGTSAEKTDYSTTQRPLTAYNNQRRSQPAGISQGFIKVDDLIDPVQAKLKARGFRGLVYLLKQIKTYDAKGIYQAFESVRIQVTQDFIKKLLNNRSEISMKSFVSRLLGEFQQWRLTLVQNAYRKLKSSNFHEMKQSFLARPRYNMSDEEVLIEFLDTFDSHHSLFKTDQVSLDEFEQYYHLLSYTIKDENHFEQAVKSGWVI
ncbi:hypothetical protein pb186bvf_004214 [Paramecium bursaria]